MGSIISIVIIICIVSILHNYKSKWKYRLKISKIKAGNTAQFFDNYFIEPRYFYTVVFNTVPCVAYIGNVDINKLFDLVKTNKYGNVLESFQRIYHNWDDDTVRFSKTLFVLENKIIIRMMDDWSDVYFDTASYDLARIVLADFKTCKAPQKEKDYEINIISLNNNDLDLKTLSIKPTTLDIDLYYNDDFKAVDAVIKERLGKENDKGIVLLHGLPGTGKTTYLRYLIGNLKKKVMFVAPSVAGNLMNPEFMDLLLDNPNAVLVIEDAENIIMDRKYSSQSSVSNLLNISDGLLSDCLNVQIICTFNSELAFIDSALLRKGRLIARYEFGKLSVDKARKLNDHLGLKTEINKPLTLAEITNADDVNPEPVKTKVIGFRREAIMEN
ncbi:AAA family ATPase [Parafilimonas sp.]|uniref:AAA family ATPase n=1 Tax=Parafilimonas sp. TaxID=1969739 RepID=UPI003F7ECDF1